MTQKSMSLREKLMGQLFIVRSFGFRTTFLPEYSVYSSLETLERVEHSLLLLKQHTISLLDNLNKTIEICAEIKKELP